MLVDNLKVYGAPWCPDCKRSKKFLAEHRVPMDWIDIDQDREGLRIVQELQHGGRSIPTIVFPDGSHLIEPSDDALARKLGLKLEASRSFYELIIVGGGPTGLAAALYAAREGITVVIVEKSSLGGQAGATKRIENYPGFPDGIDGAALAERFVAQARRYGVELLSAVEVTNVAPEEGNIVVKLSTGQELCGHVALIATGSHYRQLAVPGESELIGSGVHFCATCDGPFYRGADEILVVGGGNSALEEALFLTQFARKVRVVSHGSELRASALVQDDARRHPRIEIVLDTDIVAFNGPGKLREVVARHRPTGQELRWRPAAAFVFVGLDPNSQFLDSTVARDARGFVVTDARFRTSLAGLFAAGDVREGSTKQLGAAVGEGIGALLQIRAYLQDHHLIATPDIAEDVTLRGETEGRPRAAAPPHRPYPPSGSPRSPGRDVQSFAAGWTVAVATAALSAVLSEATHVIFHFHAIAIAVGSAWVYRHLQGERPRTARSLAFLLGVAALLSSVQSVLAPRGLADSPTVAGAIGLLGLSSAGWFLLRQRKTPEPSAAPLH